jgi:hypothetical protein
MARIDLNGLNRALLARQLLLERADVPVAEAVSRIGGLQAQWPKPPHLGLATRLARFAPADIGAAAAAKPATIVRGTFHRGTLHLVSAASYRAQRAALQPMLNKGLAAILKNRPAFDVDAVMETARAVLRQAPCTFTVLRGELVRAHPKVDERAMGYAVRMTLPLLMVPTDDPFGWPADARFCLAEDLVGPLASDRDGRRAFVREYLGAFGPATVQDAQAASGLTALAPELAALVADGEVVRLHGPGDGASAQLFDLVDAPRPPAKTAAPVRLLPEFDSCLLAHRDRARIVPPAHRAKVSLPGLRIPATFLIDGFAAGTWAVEGRGAKVKIVFTPFEGALGALKKRDRDALAEEGARLLSLVPAA